MWYDISKSQNYSNSVLFHYCLGRKKKVFKLESAKIKGKGKTTTHVRNKQHIGFNLWIYSEGSLGQQSPGFEGQLHCLGNCVTLGESLNFSGHLTYERRQFDYFISKVPFKDSNLSTIRQVCYLVPF